MEFEDKQLPLSLAELFETTDERSLKAYILIKADPKEIASIMIALSTFEGVRTADVVTGPYDIIVYAEVPDQYELGRLVINKIHSLDGVKEAITCVVVKV
ncbi:MAG: Lrp/AsnC family transcriptional regulator [Aquificae bacterium]|jgi:DNA-binding Lrp family transcriptional regulator|nr:Lrp/AsnC family transcriptional regulator [Aquificota bacterium]